MKISRWQFERELDSLIDAAKSASNRETAKRYLIQAENKIDGYDNIPYDLEKNYKQKIDDTRDELNL